MAGETPRNAMDVGAAALELPPEERAAFLDSACGDDPALRQQVESLLALETEASRFLETSPVDLGSELSTGGWPMALAVGDANLDAEFVDPTSKEMGHPTDDIGQPKADRNETRHLSHASQRAKRLEAGEELGVFRIERPLGAGGMGEVFLAVDRRLGRMVAIKLLASELTSDPHRLRRFETEARAASGLNHPNIVTIREVALRGDG